MFTVMDLVNSARKLTFNLILVLEYIRLLFPLLLYYYIIRYRYNYVPFTLQAYIILIRMFYVGKAFLLVRAWGVYSEAKTVLLIVQSASKVNIIVA